MKIFLLMIMTSFCLADHHVPTGREKDNFNPYLQTRIFKTIDNFHSLALMLETRQDADRSVYGGELSFRRNISRYVQYGIEGDFFYGLRHDDSWKKQGDSTDWKWDDKNSDLGTTLFLKLKRDFYIYKKTFSASLNFKTHNNWSRTLLTLKPELTITYHHFNNGAHKFNLYFKNKYYIPLNYSDEDVYATWYYLGALYNYKKNLMPYFFIALKEQTWTATDDFKESHDGEGFKEKSTLTYVGIGLNINLN